MARKSTKKNEILEFLHSYQLQNGYSPSVREICSAVGLSSPSSVHQHLKNLQEQGLIQKNDYKSRSIKLNYQTKHQEVPIVGKVSAGLPITAIENIESAILFPSDILNNKGKCFMLRIQGESMINAGINDGDIVIARQAPSASNGQIVIALIENEATCKRFYKEKSFFRLQPENDTMEPILVPSVEILGVVIGLLRLF